MTTSSYLIAWILYVLAASGICVIAWHLSGRWRTEVKLVSRVSLLVLLFTPYFSDPGQNWLAPAILITLFEFAFGDMQIALNSGTPLLVLLTICTAIALVYALTRRQVK